MDRDVKIHLDEAKYGVNSVYTPAPAKHTIQFQQHHLPFTEMDMNITAIDQQVMEDANSRSNLQAVVCPQNYRAQPRRSRPMSSTRLSRDDNNLTVECAADGIVAVPGSEQYEDKYLSPSISFACDVAATSIPSHSWRNCGEAQTSAWCSVWQAGNELPEHPTSPLIESMLGGLSCVIEKKRETNREGDL